MSTRHKFLILIFCVFSGVISAFTLFMKTDYARKEQKIFQKYPYAEMASRHPNMAAETVKQSEKEAIRDYHGKTHHITEGQSITISPSPKVTSSRKADIKTRLKSQKNHASPKKDKGRDYKNSKIIKSTTKKPRQNEKIPLSIPPTKVTKNSSPSNNKWKDAAEKGYHAYKKGDYKNAKTNFHEALHLKPENSEILLQLAFTEKILGHNEEAVHNFKQALDRSQNPPFHIKREIEQLNNRFEINSYLIYRDESAETRNLTGADLTQSQAGIELSYQPKKIGFQNGRKYQLYGRILSGMTHDSLDLNPDSFQSGIGIRIKPLSHHNLVVSAERLIKVGNFARNDWMLRVGYSRDYGTDYRQDKIHWWSYSLYLDAALIKPTNPDIFLTSQFTTGYNMTLSEGVVLQPRVTGHITWQKDQFRKANLIEAGPGINARFYFNDTKYEAYRSYVDVTLEYRIKISGNSIGGSGPIMSLNLHF